MLFYPTNDDASLYPQLIIGPPKGMRTHAGVFIYPFPLFQILNSLQR